MGKNNKIALIVIQNYFKNIVFYYIIRIENPEAFDTAYLNSTDKC